MIDKTLIADLVRAGVDADLVARVVAALVDSLSTPVDSRHRVDRREYQRQWAANKRGKSTSPEANDAGNVVPVSTNVDSLSTVDSVDKHRNTSSFLPSLEGLSTKEVSKKEVVARARATRLSGDQPISDVDHKFAVASGIAESAVLSVWIEFVDYWISVPGQRGTKLDWSATWRNWIRRRGEFRNGRSTDSSKSLLAAIDRQRERLGASGLDYEPQLDPLLSLPPR